MTTDHRILVVDDDHAMVRTLCDILRLRGWDATGVHSGEEAVQVACAEQYPVILMDIRMPGMDGVTAFKAMKQCAPPARKVVLMTAHTAPELLDEARREGAHDVMSKPIDLPSLMALLE
jgi:CheY-like chemotaxis protein